MPSIDSTLLQSIHLMGLQAKAASRLVAAASPAAKAGVMRTLAELIHTNHDPLLQANALDVAAAREAGMDTPRLDRLTLTPALLDDMAAACLHVADMTDPVGVIESQWQLANGLMAGKMRIPLGVVAMVYESRPNVTIDAAILCLKAGNAVILRGGSEAFHSNMALAARLHQALKANGLPMHAAQIVQTTDRAAVTALCGLDDCIDVMIPRGGEALVRTVCEAATMPVLKHYKGVCHQYVDKGADLPQALELLFNGKVQRPGVCNALECLLIHEDEAPAFLPMVATRLGQAGVCFRACTHSLPLLRLAQHAQPSQSTEPSQHTDQGTASIPDAQFMPLQPTDLGQEFHDLILAVQVVHSLDEALNHIAAYGSRHTEVICTNNHAHAMRFLREADASMVAVNASSRFNDGGQLGLGAEIGISTSKLHAYGPMGVKELTTTKCVVLGNGQVRV